MLLLSSSKEILVCARLDDLGKRAWPREDDERI